MESVGDGLAELVGLFVVSVPAEQANIEIASTEIDKSFREKKDLVC